MSEKSNPRPLSAKLKQLIERLEHAEQEASPNELSKIAAEIGATALSHLEKGHQPERLFTQMARIGVLNTIEIVPFRPTEEGEDPDVLLVQRPENDIWWPGQWHIGGTVTLSTDPVEHQYDFSGTTGRLLSKEFGDALTIKDIHHFATQRRQGGTRGDEVTLEYWAHVAANDSNLPQNARFFEVRNVLRKPLELDLLDGDHTSNLIEAALDSYRNYYNIQESETN